MRKVLLRVLAGSALVGVLAILLLWLTDSEPSWQGRSLHLWVQDLQSAQPGTRDRAVEALNAMGPEATGYLATQLSKQPGPIARFSKRVSEYIPGFIKNVLRRVYNPNKSIIAKYASAQALAVMGTNAAAAAPALGRMLHEDHVLLSGTAGAALGQLGPAAVPILIQGLDDQDFNVRSSACSALARLGTNAAPAIPRLCSILEHETGGPILSSAAYALFRIGPSAASALIPMLQSTNAALRERAAYALGGSVQSSKPARDALISALQTEDSNVRWAAAASLSQADVNDPEVAAAMLELLKDSEFRVRTIGASVFRLQPAFVRDHLSVFIGLLADPSPQVRVVAADALGQTGRNGMRAVPDLEKLLAEKEPAVQKAAARALENITGTVRQLEYPRPDVPKRQP